MADIKEVYTITFSGVVENHVGMEKVGELEKRGFSLADINLAKENFEEKGATCELICLNDLLVDNKQDAAYILIVRDGCKYMGVNPDKLLKEQKSLSYDTKLYSTRMKKVQNKHARYNLCFADFSQDADFPSGKGTIINFDSLPNLSKIRDELPEFLGDEARDLFAEGNFYYDISKCGIGYHGDAERKKVIALRLGETMNLRYRWYYRFKPVSEYLEVFLNHGDIYIMNDKAVGNDWKKSSLYTLRHAAGCKKYVITKHD